MKLIKKQIQSNEGKEKTGNEKRGKPEMKRGENRKLREGKTSQSREKNQQTQPTYDTESGNRTQATLVGGE